MLQFQSASPSFLNMLLDLHFYFRKMIKYNKGRNMFVIKKNNNNLILNYIKHVLDFEKVREILNLTTYSGCTKNRNILHTVNPNFSLF